METVSVIVPTFGDRSVWNPMAMEAVASVCRQKRIPDELIRIHRDNLHKARNEGGFAASSDWLIFLDADDELEPDYIQAMMEGQGDLRWPRVRYLSGRVRNEQALPEAIKLPEKNLLSGNYMVIGTMIRRAQFVKLGGFPDYESWEDWALYLRCWIDKAVIWHCHGAIYRCHQRVGSRVSPKDPEGLFQKIRNDVLPLVPPEMR